MNSNTDDRQTINGTSIVSVESNLPRSAPVTEPRIIDSRSIQGFARAVDLDTKSGRINDTEHVKIVNTRKEGFNGESISFPKLAARCARSISAVYTTVNAHNTEIDQKGFCARYKRMNSPLETVKV